MSTTPRIESIDVLRGLTIAMMIIVNTPGSWDYVYPVLRHAEWDGCTPTDLVFPFFTFIVGLSIAQSFSNVEGKKSLLLKIMKRSALIFLIGLLINWYPFYTKHIGNLRIFGVLQRIAAAYLISGFMIVWIKGRWLLISAVLFLLLYYLILSIGGDFTLMDNAVRHLDLAVLGPQHMYKGYQHNGENIPFDPEGILSTLGTVGNILFGYILGNNIIGKDFSFKIKTASLVGILLLVLGMVWHYTLIPINKPIWSPSYACFTSGLCSLLFALLLYIIDYHRIDGWSFPFKVFGLNALASFALSGLLVKTINIFKIDGHNIFDLFYENVTRPICGDYAGSLASAIIYCLLLWGIAYIFYKKKIFLKV